MSKTNEPVQSTLKISSATLALILTTLYFAPLNLLLLNAREIPSSPSVVLALSWKLAVALMIFTALLSAILALDSRRKLGCVIISIATLFHLQGNVFSWNYGLFDGGDIDWQAHNAVGVMEIVIWLALPALAVRYRDKIWPHIPLLALTIALMQAASLAVQLSNGKEFPTGQAMAPAVEEATKSPDEGLYDFSTEKNVLIIIADTFSSPTFEEILEKEPSIAQQLSGFTSYTNTLGVSPYTLLSIPTILSSRIYENSGTIQSFMSESFSENSLPAVFQENGYNTRVVTMGLYKGYLQWLPSQNTTSVLDRREEDTQLRHYLQLWDLTLFRYAPHYLKKQIYNQHKWLLQTRFLDPESRKDAQDVLFGQGPPMMIPTSVHRASRVIRDRFVERANTVSESPTFKFIHLFTSHTPYLMDSNGSPLSESQYEERALERRAFDQSKYALSEILDMVSKLKKLGIYDNTLIIIAADHGSDIINDSRAGFMRRSHPMLLIKPIDGANKLRYSKAPTSLLDIPITVSKALDIKADFSGYSILDGNIPSARVRNYYYFNWNSHGFWSAERLPHLEKYGITGQVDDQTAWEKSCDLNPIESGPASC